MSAYVEVYVKPDHRALIEAGSVVGVVADKGCDPKEVATPDSPMTVILRGGETLPPAYGMSPESLLMRCAGIQIIKRLGREVATCWYIADHDQFVALLAQAIESM